MAPAASERPLTPTQNRRRQRNACRLTYLENRIALLEQKLLGCPASPRHDGSTCASVQSSVEELNAPPDAWDEFYIGDAIQDRGTQTESFCKEQTIQTEIVLPPCVDFNAVTSPVGLVDIVLNCACSCLLQSVAASHHTVAAILDSEDIPLAEPMAVVANDSQSYLPPAMEEYFATIPVLPAGRLDVGLVKASTTLQLKLARFERMMLECVDVGLEVYDSCNDTRESIPIIDEKGEFTDVTLMEIHGVLCSLGCFPPGAHQGLPT